jgi:hypothetical protein
MSGVKRLEIVEVKGKEEVTNEDLKECGIYSASESSEKYGEEKHK